MKLSIATTLLQAVSVPACGEKSLTLTACDRQTHKSGVEAISLNPESHEDTVTTWGTATKRSSALTP